jgi:hypothetical protein
MTTQEQRRTSELDAEPASHTVRSNKTFCLRETQKREAECSPPVNITLAKNQPARIVRSTEVAPQATPRAKAREIVF